MVSVLTGFDLFALEVRETEAFGQEPADALGVAISCYHPCLVRFYLDVSKLHLEISRLVVSVTSAVTAVSYGKREANRPSDGEHRLRR